MPPLQQIVQTVGITEMITKLDPQLFRETVKAVGGDAVAPVVEAVAASAPQRSGKLARSVRSETRSRGPDLEVVVGTGVPYGHLVDRGHRLVVGGATTRATTALGRLRAFQSGRFTGREIGFVPGRHFAEAGLRRAEHASGGVVEALETNLQQVLGW